MARRSKGRRRLVIAALILVPLAVAVVGPAMVLWPRLALLSWVRAHGEIGWDGRPAPQWVPESLEYTFRDVFNRILHVDLKDVEVEPGRMRALGELPRVNRMTLSGVTSAGGPLFPAEGFPSLEELLLTDVSLSGESLARLGRAPNLGMLRLSRVELGSTRPFADEPFPSLTALWVANDRLSREALEHVGAVGALESLIFEEVELASTAPFAGGGFRDIEDLHLWGAGPMSREDMGHIAKIPRLNRLHLAGYTLEAGALEGLTDLKRELKTLALNGCNVGDEVVDAILEHGALERLHLDATRLTDTGLMRLGGLSKLKELRVSATKVTGEGIRRFSEAHPGVQVKH